jgi:hypothetical protein
MMQDRKSGGEALAALATTIGDHAAATDGGHARAEAMTAGADQLAGLIGTFHGTNSENQEVRCIRSCRGRVNHAIARFVSARDPARHGVKLILIKKSGEAV